MAQGHLGLALTLEPAPSATDHRWDYSHSTDEIHKELRDEIETLKPAEPDAHAGPAEGYFTQHTVS